MRKQGRFTVSLVGGVVAVALSLVPATASAVDVQIDAVSETGNCVMVHFPGPAQNGVNWVGVPTSSSNAAMNAMAQRFLTLATAALLSGKTFRIGVSNVLCGTNTNVKSLDLYEVKQ